MIAKGTPLPVSQTEIFTTTDPGQSSIKIKPFQGENSRVSFNKRLGLYEVTEIPAADPGEPLIHVTFHVDAQGAFSLAATDAGTGRDLPVLRRSQHGPVAGACGETCRAGRPRASDPVPGRA